MAIFNCYVSSPEGTPQSFHLVTLCKMSSEDPSHGVKFMRQSLNFCKLVELLTWVIDGYWWLLMAIGGYWCLLMLIDGYWLSIDGSCWANYLELLWTSGCWSTTPNKFTNSFPSSMIWLLSALIVAQHLKAGAKDYPSGKLKLKPREISVHKSIPYSFMMFYETPPSMVPHMCKSPMKPWFRDITLW